MLLWVGAQMHTSNWSVLTSLFLAFVLWSRQIGGSRDTTGIQDEDSPFSASCERPERYFRLDVGDPQLLEK